MMVRAFFIVMMLVSSVALAQFTAPCYNITTSTWGPCVPSAGAPLGSGPGGSTAVFIDPFNRSIVFPAGACLAYGSSPHECVLGEFRQGTAAPPNGSLKKKAFTCTDTGGAPSQAEIYGDVVMPEGWDGGALDFHVRLWHHDVLLGVDDIAYELKCQCVAIGTAPSPYSSVVANATGAVTLPQPSDYSDFVFGFSAVTCPGVCSPDALLFWKLVPDVAGLFTAPTANVKIREVVVTYERANVSD